MPFALPLNSGGLFSENGSKISAPYAIMSGKIISHITLLTTHILNEYVSQREN